MKVFNPATGEELRKIDEDTDKSIAAKFLAAKEAQQSWYEIGLSTRKSIIEQFKKNLITNQEKLAAILSLETGKPIKQAQNELQGTVPRIDFFLENVNSVMNSQEVTPGKELIRFEPLGVIGNISAWNYPYFVGTNVFIPALLTGNTVLYKGSEFCPSTGLEIQRLLIESGLPANCFCNIIGDGKAGSTLLQQDIDAVFFTGSQPTGRRISQTVSGRLIKLQLELGGKDPVYVSEDVGVKSAAEALADGAFYNNGQSCCSVERIYVHADIAAEFTEHFVTIVKGFSIGDPSSEETYIGPLTRKEHIAFLEAQVADATAKGAKLECGGQKIDSNGYYFAPTVFTGVNHSMNLMIDESFGPIIGIQVVSGDEEAVNLMNDTNYGLTAGIFTRDFSRAERVLSKMNSGTVYVNCCDRVSPRLPWTGRGYSGLGSSLSKIGIQSFVQPKAWHINI